MPDFDIIEYRRMLQRRGLESQLEQLRDGELALATDKNKMYFGNNGNNIALLNELDVIDDLETTSKSKPLSSNQGKVLDVKISSLEQLMLQNNVNINEELINKQDLILSKSDNPPSNTELIWFNTN